jgi:hypothetical protein
MHLRDCFHIHIQPKLKTMTKHIANQLLLYIRLSIVAVCLLATFGLGYPPVHAQRTTTEDALQDQHLAEIEKHLSSTDSRLDDLKKHQEETDHTIATWAGAFSATLLIVGILSGWGVAIQIKQKNL